MKKEPIFKIKKSCKGIKVFRSIRVVWTSPILCGRIPLDLEDFESEELKKEFLKAVKPKYLFIETRSKLKKKKNESYRRN